MNNFLYLEISNASERKIVEKFLDFDIQIFDISYINNKYIVKIDAQDERKVFKYIKTLNIKKYKYQGIKELKYLLKKYYLIVIFFLISFIFVLIQSFLIVDIKVLHEDDSLVNLILSDLEKYGVKKFHFQKSFADLQLIKEKIKNDHPDKIDWLEIEKDGMNYIVRLEKRIIKDSDEVLNYCHIIATKDGLVKDFSVKAGDAKISINDYVKKGDVLISGDILLNESVVNHVCAEGNVDAESWYTVNISLPFNYEENIFTGKKRYNFVVNYDGVDHQILRNRLKNFESNQKLIFDLMGIKIYLKTDQEIKKVSKIYNEEEAIDKAIELAKEKVRLSLGKNDEIISEKVLQKNVIDSKINVDVFIVAKENIAKKIQVKE